MKTFNEYMEARDLLGREVPDFYPADLLQKTRKIREPDAAVAVQMQLDTRKSNKASNMTYDPQSGNAEVTYKDGTKKKFKGLKYPDAHRSSSADRIDQLISDLENGRLGASV